MGWKGEGDDEDVAPSLAKPNPRNSTEDRCSTKKIVRSSCRTEEVEPGRFVKKCNKTEQILRDCIGGTTKKIVRSSCRTEEVEPGRFVKKCKTEQILRDCNGGITRKIVRSSCRTEEVEPGRFVKKCNKTEQILRDIGRPTEIMESKNEHTEDDVTDKVANGKHPLDPPSPGLEPFSFPGLRRDIESIERSLSGGLGHFIEAAEQMAEEMMKGFFHSLNIPSRRCRESPSFGRWLPSDGSKQMDEPSAYNGLPGEIIDA